MGILGRIVRLNLGSTKPCLSEWSIEDGLQFLTREERALLQELMGAHEDVQISLHDTRHFHVDHDEV